MANNYGLGRGLSSLIPQKKSSAKISEPRDDFNYFGKKDSAPTSSGGGILEVELFKIVPNPYQPRVEFDQEKLIELAESIKQHGILQPLVVSKTNGNQFELIAGERRFQASKLAGLEKVPVIIREVDNQEKLELAIVENIQRHNLNPVEEAKSYFKLQEEFGMSQEEVAKKLGKSRSVVANKLRLLTLPVEIQKALQGGKITEGHAKAILALPNPEKQKALFEMIIKNKLNVRQVESKVREISVKPHKRIISENPQIRALEDSLAGKLGTRVKVSPYGKGGKIIIEYYSQEELDNLVSKIN